MENEFAKLALALLSKITDPVVLALLAVIVAQLLFLRHVSTMLMKEQQYTHSMAEQLGLVSTNIKELATLIEVLVYGRRK